MSIINSINDIWTIYILKLECDKYYVGKTQNHKARILHHFDGNASAWTTKYKPLEVIRIINDCDSFDEDKYTIKYMKKYGIDNVRGGSFATIKLSAEVVSVITRMINGSTDCCYHCGGSHFIKNCPNKSVLRNENKDDDNKEWIIIEACSRCNRIGHSINQCYARGSAQPDIYNNPHQNIAHLKQSLRTFFTNIFYK